MYEMVRLAFGWAAGEAEVYVSEIRRLLPYAMKNTEGHEEERTVSADAVNDTPVS